MSSLDVIMVAPLVLIGAFYVAVAMAHVCVLGWSTRMFPRGELAELVARSKVRRLEVRKMPIWLRDERFRALGMSYWTPWASYVYLDTQFLKVADVDQLKFVFSHELGHHALGHTRESFLRLVTGAWIFWLIFRSASKLDRADREDDADDYAEWLSGVRSIVLDRGAVRAYYRGATS